LKINKNIRENWRCVLYLTEGDSAGHIPQIRVANVPCIYSSNLIEDSCRPFPNCNKQQQTTDKEINEIIKKSKFCSVCVVIQRERTWKGIELSWRDAVEDRFWFSKFHWRRRRRRRVNNRKRLEEIKFGGNFNLRSLWTE
jgi:hypothetical protein